MYRACTSTPPLLFSGGNHYFQPHASLLVSTLVAIALAILWRLARARSAAADPRTSLTRLVCEAAVLPREMQRAIVRELRHAFPDAPALHDLRALAVRSEMAQSVARSVNAESNSPTTSPKRSGRGTSWMEGEEELEEPVPSCLKSTSEFLLCRSRSSDGMQVNIICAPSLIFTRPAKRYFYCQAPPWISVRAVTIDTKSGARATRPLATQERLVGDRR